jgi:AraC family transcriptional regulator
MPVLSIDRVERAEQPILYIRRQVARSELPGMLAECFGTLFAHCQQAGLAIAGAPVARYVAMDAGQLTVEAAMVLAAPAKGEGEIQAGTLPAGPAAVGVHAGPYEGLPDTNAAIERWIKAQGLRVGGAPWESYVTDPGQFPNPADWRTEVYWPLANN